MYKPLITNNTYFFVIFVGGVQANAATINSDATSRKVVQTTPNRPSRPTKPSTNNSGTTTPNGGNQNNTVTPPTTGGSTENNTVVSDPTELANQFMNNWMNSEGHRKNILSTNFSSIGVGVYKIGNKVYATQEFYK